MIFSNHSNTEIILHTTKNIKYMTFQASVLKRWGSSFLIPEREHLFYLILEVDISFLLNITMVLARNMIT